MVYKNQLLYLQHPKLFPTLSDVFKICHTDFKEGGCILNITHLCFQLSNFQVCFIQQIIWVFAVKPKAC